MTDNFKLFESYKQEVLSRLKEDDGYLENAITNLIAYTEDEIDASRINCLNDLIKPKAE